MPTVPLDEYVDRLVAEAPPLTPEQADHLVTLLRTAPADDREAA